MNDELQKALQDNGGILKTSDAMEICISKDLFYRFIEDAGLQKAAHGIYVSPNTLIDEMYLLQLQFPMAVFSHETALYLHDLAEMEPIPLTVSVPGKYNCPGLICKGVRIAYVKGEWHSIGLCQVPSPGGHMVNAYNMERTICDIIRRRSEMDVAAFNYALTQYVKRRDKDLVRLSEYAQALHMEKRLWATMGVLL